MGFQRRRPKALVLRRNDELTQLLDLEGAGHGSWMGEEGEGKKKWNGKREIKENKILIE
jgi:hypothetical protein